MSAIDLDTLTLAKGAHRTRDHLQRFAPEPTAERFWAQVDRAGECWEWLGRRSRDGYGRTSLGGARNRGAHRLAWELAHGTIPPGLCVCHHCDNPGCVRPDHLFLGTIGDNNRDRHRKGRSRNLQPGAGHPKAILTEAQVREMRALWADGWTQQRLADRFGTARSNVSKIVRGESYR